MRDIKSSEVNLVSGGADCCSQQTSTFVGAVAGFVVGGPLGGMIGAALGSGVGTLDGSAGSGQISDYAAA
jgi:hypothetical protein